MDSTPSKYKTKIESCQLSNKFKWNDWIKLYPTVLQLTPFSVIWLIFKWTELSELTGIHWVLGPHKPYYIPDNRIDRRLNSNKINQLGSNPFLMRNADSIPSNWINIQAYVHDVFLIRFNCIFIIPSTGPIPVGLFNAKMTKKLTGLTGLICNPDFWNWQHWRVIQLAFKQTRTKRISCITMYFWFAKLTQFPVIESTSQPIQGK